MDSLLSGVLFILLSPSFLLSLGTPGKAIFFPMIHTPLKSMILHTMVFMVFHWFVTRDLHHMLIKDWQK